MNAMPFVLLAACSPFEALCSRGDNCGSNLDRTIEAFALRDGDRLTLPNGREIRVRVLFGALIQRNGEDPMITDGVCGFWSPAEDMIEISVSPRCGPLEATLLHELGHAYHLRHGTGIMARNYAGPVTEEDAATLLGEVLR